MRRGGRGRVGSRGEGGIERRGVGFREVRGEGGIERRGGVP